MRQAICSTSTSWLALAALSHVHHGAARAYWMLPVLPRLWFNRITMLGLVRLLCEPKIMGAAKLSPTRALEVYEHFEALPEVGFMASRQPVVRPSLLRCARWRRAPAGC